MVLLLLISIFLVLKLLYDMFLILWPCAVDRKLKSQNLSFDMIMIMLKSKN